MSAPENRPAKVDGFIVAIDMVAVAAFLAGFTALLFGVDYLVAELVHRHPAWFDFARTREFAIMLVAGGIVVLFGIAALLLFLPPKFGRERGK